jgi:hypothetical protein
MNRIAAFVSVSVFGVLMILLIMAERYHYRDCLRVGHTKLYCVLDRAR